jgi:hypothetical protein
VTFERFRERLQFGSNSGAGYCDIVHKSGVPVVYRPREDFSRQVTLALSAFDCDEVFCDWLGF